MQEWNKDNKMKKNSTIFELREDLDCLICHFAWRIGRAWEDIDKSFNGAVGTIYHAQQLAEEFLALWESKVLETLEDFDESWEFYIDEYFSLYLKEN